MIKEFHCVTVGNPNAGKSTLFNALTGGNQQIGNWSGVTVEKKTGSFLLENTEVLLTDLPGIYDLLPAGNSCDCSLDEQISQQYLAEQKIDAIINLVDGTNIERHLYLSVQLRELGIPMVVIVNKMDVAQKHGITIDFAEMSKQLNCPVIGVCSKDSDDTFKVKSQVVDLLEGKISGSALSIEYDPEIEVSIDRVLKKFPDITRGSALAMFSHGLGCSKCAESDTLPEVSACAETLKVNGKDIEVLIAAKRYEYVEQIYSKAVTGSDRETLTSKLDKIILHPIFGVPVFLLVMYLTFMFAINVGSSFIDFFDISAGAIFVDHFGALLASMGSPEWLITILAGGIGQGIQTVATFIPVIAALFLALSVLESSGYMSRAAFVVDGLMRRIGLPGKAFVPMIVGFGCSVPAIMATRTLGSERERIITGMMAPFMSCGARLPVYALFAAAFFPESGQNLVFLLYIIGIFAAIGTGLMLRKTLLQGSSSAVVMELPDYEIPKLKATIKRAGKRTMGFIKGAGKTIVIVVMLLNFINSIGVDGSFGNQDSSNSVLSLVSQKITPAFAPMGVEQHNWPATVGIVTGIFAKEAVVGTLNSLYSPVNTHEEDELAPISESVTQALATIPENLFGISMTDPMGVEIGNVLNKAEVAEEQGVDLSTFSALQAGFATTAAAFSYLLFVLLYTPCVAAMGALVNEYGAKWARFAALWTFGLAYGTATIVYQVATFTQHPVSSSSWIVGFILLLVIFYQWLKNKGKKQQQIIPNIRIVTQ